MDELVSDSEASIGYVRDLKPTIGDEDSEFDLPQQAKRVVARKDKGARRPNRSPSMSGQSDEESIAGRRPIARVEPETPVLGRRRAVTAVSKETSDTETGTTGSTESGTTGREETGTFSSRRSAQPDEEKSVRSQMRPEGSPEPERGSALDAPLQRFRRTMSFADSVPAIPAQDLRARRLRRSSTYYTDNTPPDTPVSSLYATPAASVSSEEAAILPPAVQPVSQRRLARPRARGAPIGRPAARVPAPARAPAPARVPAPARAAAPTRARAPVRADPLQTWKYWRSAFGWADPAYRQDWVTGRLYGRTRRRQRLFTPPARA